MTRLSWVTVDTQIGPVSAACSEVGVARVRFGPPPPAAVAPAGPDGLAAAAVAPAGPDGLAAAARDQLAGYFSGARTAFDLPLDWGACSETQREVLSLLSETVPFGQTISYGELDDRLAARDRGPGSRRASFRPGESPGASFRPGKFGARAIGTIMGSNPIPLIVPCHRVVAADGLGGFSGGCGIELKRWLLTFEGALPAMLDFGAPMLTRPGG